MVPIIALSRSPAILSIEIDSSSILASSSLRTGVLPTLTTCLGLWTDVAGLVSSVPPETSQSKHLLIAERCCLTEGRERGSCSTYAATWMGLMAVEAVEPPLLAPVHETGDGAVVGLAGVGVTDGDGEEVDEPPGGAVVGARRSWAGAGLRMRRAGLPACPGRAVGSWIVLIFGGIRESYKKTIITTFMKGFISAFGRTACRSRI